MIKTVRLTAIAVLLIFSTVTLSHAQEDGGDPLKYRKWRVTLINPLGTNGVDALDYTAKYSINILGGAHGGLDGAEIGGFFNYTRHYSAGMQLAGFANISSGRMEGLQIAGFMNGSSRAMSGLQISGFANLAGRSVSGLQVSGFVNGSRASMDGLLVTGGLNLAGTSASGLHVAGIGTLAGQHIDGLIISGVLTASKGSLSGLAVSGVLNSSQSMDGLAAAGILNLSKRMSGLQAAPINIAETASGVQIGLINLAREFEGAPVGLISLYGNGRKNVDFRFSDGGFTDIGINLGTYRVYNMLFAGYNPLLTRDVYRVGVAVGMEKPLSDAFRNMTDSSLFINQELSYTHHIEGSWSWDKNGIWSYKYLLGKRFGNGLSLYAGPTFNLQIVRTSIEGANEYTWYSFWSPSGHGRDYRFWVGFTTGIRIFKQEVVPSSISQW
ncbi:hypothetical protein [Rhodohalobacter mucosus]|uniref:Uncharacterized protein n=1 Tax=Rhodohalobacter mucosus TaxID=2079485 RepID=A0A316TSQ6_9BACT|nr:hypothetical protein [Rhodohalobacter mucosus]PWN05995.1 hypothetical protein DDZ15_12505 [Rhodohalobacter mucosus]